jgi:hypothetical protein
MTEIKSCNVQLKDPQTAMHDVSVLFKDSGYVRIRNDDTHVYVPSERIQVITKRGNND